MTKKTVDQEAADAEQVRQAAGRRPRRARRLHAEPEVTGHVCEQRALARHPLSGRGALMTTVSAVCSSRWSSRCVTGCSSNPYRGPGGLRRRCRRLFVLGLLLIPPGMWLERRRLQRHPEAEPTGRCSTSGRPATRRGALPHRAHRRQRRHRLLAGTAPALDGIAGVLRPGVPYCRCIRSSPRGRPRRTRKWRAPSATSARGRGRWCVQDGRHAAAVSRHHEHGAHADPRRRGHAAGARDVRHLSLGRP